MSINFKKLYDIVNTFPAYSALCIGDMMLDEYISGPIYRISPEAPVPVIQKKNTKQALGGVGNVAANLAALGYKTSVFYAAAPDQENECITKMLEKQNISAYPFLASTITTKKQRIIANKQQICRLDEEEPLTLTKQQEDKIIHQISTLLPHVNVVAISDYNKGFITPRIAQGIIEEANKLFKDVLVSPKGDDYTKYTGATLLKPNLTEFKSIIKKVASGVQNIEKLDPANNQDLEKIKQLSPIVRDILGVKNLVITLGEYGLMASDEKSTTYHHTSPQSVVDISGAGDTTLAILSAATGACTSLENALDLANIGSGVVVKKEGTTTISHQELKSTLHNIFSVEPITFTTKTSVMNLR